MAALIPRPNYPPYSASGAVDAGREEVDEILLRLERRVHREYVQAAREMKEKADAYLAYFQEEDAKRAQWVADGKITDAEYKQWRISHIATGRRWYEMAYVLTTDMTNTNQIASSMINGYLPDVFAVGYNYGLYQGEITGGFQTSFTLYDRDTVIRLMRDNPDLLPIEASVNVPKDLLWNRQQLSSIMTQGILQGETIDQIANRIATAMPSMNEKTAIRHARTAFTSAENGGRYESYRRMKKAGVDLTVEWCATLDGRTRHTHRLADGERRDVDEPFDVDGYNIMYAGDPQAPQRLIWNCRCTMLAWVKDFEPSDELKYQTRPDNMSYSEWKYAKQAEYEQQQERARQRAQINPDNPSYGYANRNPFEQYASAVDMGTLYEAQNGAGYYQEQQIPPRNDLTLRNDDGIMQDEEARERLREMERNGDISITINQEMQRRHFYGTDEYSRFVDDDGVGKSYFYEEYDYEWLQSFLRERFASGKIYFSGSNVNEVFEYSEELAFDTRVNAPTRFIKAIYSRTRTHFTPYTPM